MSSSKATELLPEILSENSNSNDDDIDATHTVSESGAIEASNHSVPSSLIRQSSLTFNPNLSEGEFMMLSTQDTKPSPNHEQVQALGNVVAMHLGAGYHSRMNEGRHRELGKR